MHGSQQWRDELLGRLAYFDRPWLLALYLYPNGQLASGEYWSNAGRVLNSRGTNLFDLRFRAYFPSPTLENSAHIYRLMESFCKGKTVVTNKTRKDIVYYDSWW